MTKWKKPSTQTLATFAKLAADLPGEPKQMFGMPCRFLHGHMFFGVFQDTLVVRLAPEDLAAFLASGTARPFVAMGRQMREWAQHDVTPQTGKTLVPWLAHAVRFVGGLPAKTKKARKTRRLSAGAKAQGRGASRQRSAQPRASRAR
jgi:hypothetical protein